MEATVPSYNDVRISSSRTFCNWAGIGIFGLNLQFRADMIDFDRRVIGAHYRFWGGGIMNGGGGSGIALLNSALPKVEALDDR